MCTQLSESIILTIFASRFQQHPNWQTILIFIHVTHILITRRSIVWLQRKFCREKNISSISSELCRILRYYIPFSLKIFLCLNHVYNNNNNNNTIHNAKNNNNNNTLYMRTPQSKHKASKHNTYISMDFLAIMQTLNSLTALVLVAKQIHRFFLCVHCSFLQFLGVV